MNTSAQSRSALTGWVLAIIRAMRTEGVDVDAVLAEIGMNPTLLEGGYSRYSQQQISELWRRAVNITGDPLFCLRVAKEVRPASFHVVGYAMSCSATLERALQRFARYCRLISDSAAATLTEHEDVAVLEFHFDTGGAPPIYQTVDAVVAAILSFVRWIASEPLEPLEVRLNHPQLVNAEAYEAFFGSPVRYGDVRNCIVFRKTDLQRPILCADEELATLLDGAANRYLEKRMAGRFAVRVRDLLIAQLPNGVSKAQVARMLNITQRTLLRRLKTEGTTFAGVINQVREQLAFQYLERGNMTNSEIAYRLGFSDEGTFSRSFKRWTGRRPSAVARAASTRGQRVPAPASRAAHPR
ncbi:MAG: AraC family transcriptional regulator [Steroidobacteraceae bacterium]